MKKTFIEIRLCNRMTFVFKWHVKIFKIYMMKFNASILKRLKIMVFWKIQSIYINIESAKLRALRAHVPTCLACLRANVLTCSRVNVPCVLACFACLLANIPCVLKCSYANVFVCLPANVPRVPCLTCQDSLPD